MWIDVKIVSSARPLACYYANYEYDNTFSQISA